MKRISAIFQQSLLFGSFASRQKNKNNRHASGGAKNTEREVQGKRALAEYSTIKNCLYYLYE
ncbi:hypothetical protein ABTP88_17580, partial [Acinetobacter baumannii]